MYLQALVLLGLERNPEKEIQLLSLLNVDIDGCVLYGGECSMICYHIANLVMKIILRSLTF